MVQVVAALIKDGERFLVFQRPAHKTRGLLWEFVGGKVEKGETKQQALVRECREELDVSVKVHDVYMELVHEYPDMTVELTLFNAEIENGEPRLLEHNASAWITADEIENYDFCPADKDILQRIKADAKADEAMRILESENAALVLLGENEKIQSNERGVAALLRMYGEKMDLSSFCAADKIVGKGAAVLFSLLNIKEVYAQVMSKEAKEILEENAVIARFKVLSENIINRRGDDICPIEKAVGKERNLQKALELIKNKIADMKKQ